MSVPNFLNIRTSYQAFVLTGSKISEFPHLSTMSSVISGHEMTLRNTSEASAAMPLILYGLVELV